MLGIKPAPLLITKRQTWCVNHYTKHPCDPEVEYLNAVFRNEYPQLKYFVRDHTEHQQAVVAHCSSIDTADLVEGVHLGHSSNIC
jgi:hypothetical protein